jgi:hypothetical protein
MKTVINKTEKQVNNKEVVNKVESKKIDLLKAVKVEKTAKVKIASNYKDNVIIANQKLNTEKNSLGAYLDLLQKYNFILCNEFKTFISDIKNGDKNKYELLKNAVKVTAKGKFNQFYTLQGLQKVCFPKK